METAMIRFLMTSNVWPLIGICAAVYAIAFVRNRRDQRDRSLEAAQLKAAARRSELHLIRGGAREQ
jgi:hypothetical protein